MDNKGYFQAEIDTTKVVKEKKLDLTYHVTANDPYHIRNYTISFPNTDLQQIAASERFRLLREGMRFDVDLMNQERQRIASAMTRHE